MPEAAKVVGRWGGLHEPVRITVVDSHWNWRRWWSAPLPGISAWGGGPRRPAGPGRGGRCRRTRSTIPALAAVIRRTQVTGLLKHELTHSLMFQRAGRLLG